MVEKQSITGASVLLFSMLFVCASLTTLAGQRRRQPQTPAATTRAKAKPPVPTPREPEIQLERLPPDPSVEAADIAITANVRARSLVFETVPNPTVTFPGTHTRETVWEAQRENLPTPVEPGVTYRNIGIRLKITSVFRDIDQIVAEALGEVAITDDTKTAALEPSHKSSDKTPAPSSIKADRSRSPKRKR